MALIRRSALGSVHGIAPTKSLMRAQVKVVGTTEAIRKLGLVGSVAGRDAGLIVLHSAYDIRNRAREIVHSKSNPWSGSEGYEYTDNLKSGINVTRGPGGGGRAGALGSYTQQVTASSKDGGSDREYAAYEEFGTKKAPAHPYLRPATSQQVPLTVAALNVLARKLERL